MSKTESGLFIEYSSRPLPRGRRIWAALCLGIGIIAIGYFLQLQIQARTSKQKMRLNQPLPSMIVEASGTKVDLKNVVHGMRCVIVFHSPSCRICREMLPSLRPFPPGLRLILVDESRSEKDPEISGLPGAIIFQDRHRIFSRFFGAASLPVMLFVDETGALKNGLAGRHSRDFVRTQLKTFASGRQSEPGQNP